MCNFKFQDAMVAKCSLYWFHNQKQDELCFYQKEHQCRQEEWQYLWTSREKTSKTNLKVLYNVVERQICSKT